MGLFLLNFFMHSMLVAMGTELVQFQTSRGITTVFGGGITGNPRRALRGITATLGAFEGDNQSSPLSFFTGHSGLKATVQIIRKR